MRDPPLPPARDDHVRRSGTAGTPTRPHHVPHRLHGGLRGGRGPRGIPARRRAPAAAEDLLQPDLQPQRIVAFHEAPHRAGGGEPYAEWLENWQDRKPRVVTTKIHCADYYDQRDRACWRTRPRSTRTAPSSGCRGGPAACGRPRSTKWRCRTSWSSRSRTTSSPAWVIASADALATKAGLSSPTTDGRTPVNTPQHRCLPGDRWLWRSSCSPSPSGCPRGT